MEGRWNWEGGEAAGWIKSDLGECQNYDKKIVVLVPRQISKRICPEICGAEVAAQKLIHSLCMGWRNHRIFKNYWVACSSSGLNNNIILCYLSLYRA
jgi:hypothetical protein